MRRALALLPGRCSLIIGYQGCGFAVARRSVSSSIMSQAVDEDEEDEEDSDYDEYLKTKVDGLSRESDLHSYRALILACGDAKSLALGKRVHSQVIVHGLEDRLSLASCLVNMYLKCSSPSDAWSVFRKLPRGDIVTWTRLVAAFARNGDLDSALFVFSNMLLVGVRPDKIAFVTLVAMCSRFGAVHLGRTLQNYAVEAGVDQDVVVGNALVDFYGKCGLANEASLAFSKVAEPDVISWNTLLFAAQQKSYKGAIQIFGRMQLEGCKPDKFTLVTLLNATSSSSSSMVKQIHDRAAHLQLLVDTVVCNALVNAYGRSAQLGPARRVFESTPSKDLISWHAFIAACTQAGRNLEALACYRRMQLQGIRANEITYLILMDAFTGSIDELPEARSVHRNIAESGYDNLPAVGNAVITIYGKVGDIGAARRIFDKMQHRDVVSWNSLISAYAQNGYSDYIMDVYRWMQLEGVRPTNVTFATMVNACCDLEAGRCIHANIVEAGYQENDVVTNALVDMYGKRGSMDEASKLFCSTRKQKSVVLWTAMMTGNLEAGRPAEALTIFKQLQLEGVKPNRITLVTAINACSLLTSAVEECRRVAEQVTCSGYGSDWAVRNALLNMYGKCGSLEDVDRVFVGDMKGQLDVIAGTVLVNAYANHGEWKLAIQIYQRMHLEGQKPNSTTYVSLLVACSSLGTLRDVQKVLPTILEAGYASKPLVQSALINLYGKSEVNLQETRKMFEEMNDKTVVPWTAIVAAYAHHGYTDEARKLFYQMQQEGVKPDSGTSVKVLSVCSHAGLVKEACYYFSTMTKEFCIPATMAHYGCMVDLLGRAGWLAEAEAFVKRMEMKPDVVIWTSLLSASKRQGDLEIARRAAKQVIQLEPHNPDTYVQLSNIYAATGCWDDVEKLKKLVLESKAPAKIPTCSLKTL